MECDGVCGMYEPFIGWELPESSLLEVPQLISPLCDDTQSVCSVLRERKFDREKS